jgi:hypothetical protein
VPVIAYAATAVPATMDGGGVLVTEKDPVHVAALVDRIVTDRALEARIICSQDAALRRLGARDFGGTLLRFVEQVQRSVRRQHPPIAFDFWDQVKLADELEELRTYRPAAFQALPKAVPGAQSSVDGKNG